MKNTKKNQSENEEMRGEQVEKLEWIAPTLEKLSVEATAGKPKMWPNEFNTNYGAS